MRLLIYVLPLEKERPPSSMERCERNSDAMTRVMDVRDTKEISLADLPASQGLLHNIIRNSKYSLSF